MLKDDQEECSIPIEKKDLAAVFPNAGDHGYFLLCFDEKSLQFFKHNTSVNFAAAKRDSENPRVNRPSANLDQLHALLLYPVLTE